MYFPSSIHSTNSEEKLWKRFWENQGVSRLDIAYRRGLDEPPAEKNTCLTSDDIAELLEGEINPGKTRVVGLVVDTIDKIMHGMQLGSSGMHNQIRQWCQKGFLSGLIKYLLDEGFAVWLTADHGNIECQGQGRPSEGVLAETRGERARIYQTPELRTQTASKFPFSHEWKPIGLPGEYCPLLAAGRDAFLNPGNSLVGHGGVSIEEVIVPFVKFETMVR